MSCYNENKADFRSISQLGTGRTAFVNVNVKLCHDKGPRQYYRYKKGYAVGKIVSM